MKFWEAGVTAFLFIAVLGGAGILVGTVIYRIWAEVGASGVLAGVGVLALVTVVAVLIKALADWNVVGR